MFRVYRLALFEIKILFDWNKFAIIKPRKLIDNEAFLQFNTKLALRSQ